MKLGLNSIEIGHLPGLRKASATNLISFLTLWPNILSLDSELPAEIPSDIPSKTPSEKDLLSTFFPVFSVIVRGWWLGTTDVRD